MKKRPGGLFFFVVLALIVLISSRFIAGTLIDYAWWNELHQVDTWINLLLYGTVPILLAILFFFAAFWTAFRLGIRHTPDAPLYGFLKRSFVIRVAAIVLALFSIGVANSTVDSWTIVRYFGGLRQMAAPGEFIDPIFQKPLHFYLFDLPFFNLLLNRRPRWRCPGAAHLLDGGARDSVGRYYRTECRERRRSSLNSSASAACLIPHLSAQRQPSCSVGVAVKIYFDRYALLLEDHGQYLVGVDWVADHVVIPLQWLLILGALAAAALFLARKPRWAALLLLLVPVRYILPSIVAGLYVRPNELALEKPYIRHHIEATRSAYHLDRRVKETSLEAEPEVPIDYAKHKPLLDNVRLWAWQPFHDTISQIQPLRPYVYMDTDVDRYTIDGQIRQVMISPRELDIRQLGEASNRWINPHLIYTHGYGVVMAEANRITPDGLPLLFIKDAPPVVTPKSLHFTRPEIYYSEVAHEPVFVDTAQQEFNYPSGSETIKTTYGGTGGFPVSSVLMRLAAALHYGDANIILTEYLTGTSRMMIHRPIRDRLRKLAGFLSWDSDPYLVLTDSGRLVWIADGYMSSDVHPYSREIDLGNQSVNYLRNSVKATIDAYTGETNLYIFDQGDVLITGIRTLVSHAV